MSVSNRRIGELIGEIEEDKLEIRPFFQRRQVWTNSDKEFFIDTVLKGFPFPEVFVATGTIDLVNIKRKKWLVDGQQRLSTLKDFVRGSTDLLYKTVRPYSDLTSDEQTKLLDYEVAVRDLGTVGPAVIKEIFRRINSTDYALKSMEVLNAMFSGEYKKYCEALSRNAFFVDHKVFSPAVRKRMYDITFCVILVTTVLSGYFRRDEKNEEFLERYNDDFPQQDEIQTGLDRVFDFVERCGFEAKSRAWNQTDLFTLLVELYAGLVVEKLSLDAVAVGIALNGFFGEVDQLYKGKRLPPEEEVPATQAQVFKYLKAATKATNDKYARVERAEVISKLIRSTIAAPRAKGAGRHRKKSGLPVAGRR